MLFLAYCTYNQLNAYMRNSPDYGVFSVREKAARVRAEAGLQPHELPKGQKLKDHDFLLEHFAHTMNGHFGHNGPANICLPSEIGDFRYSVELFDNTANKLRLTHKAEYIEAQRESMRGWAKSIIERGRLSFDNMPDTVKATLLKSGYVPPRVPKVDSCLGYTVKLKAKDQ
jgi:hypothetical protein